MRQRLVVVGSCRSRVEAEVQRSVLHAAGFDVHLAADDAGGLHPELSLATCSTYRLLVPEVDLDDAVAVLADTDVGEPLVEGEALPPSGPRPRGVLSGGQTLRAAVAAGIAAVLVTGVVYGVVDVVTG